MLKVSLTIAAAGLLAACGVSTQQEVQIGQDAAQQVNAQLPMVQDAVINNYVNALGNRIASRTSRADLNWQFQVVNSSTSCGGIPSSRWNRRRAQTSGWGLRAR